MQKKQILIVTVSPIFPPDSGGNMSRANEQIRKNQTLFVSYYPWNAPYGLQLLYKRRSQIRQRNY